MPVILSPFSISVKLGDFTSAVQSFERALEMAKIVKDEFAEAAIKKALEDVNQKIVNDLKPKEEATKADEPTVEVEPNVEDEPTPTEDAEGEELESQDDQ